MRFFNAVQTKTANMKSVICAFICLLSLPLMAQSLYDVSSITQVDIVFEESNWDELMDDYYENDLGERLTGTCTVNGNFYDSVGVAFKGNSTYDATQEKNPLNIKLDYVLEQRFQGYSTLKLSNGSKDPSFVREVLSYEIGRNYMDMPLANYAKVTINGDYYGLFSSAEAIDGDYQERRLYCDDDNTRIKCNPVSVFDGGSSLEYLGTDSSDYFDFYELKSDFGWNDIKDFTYDLENNLATIEEFLDVDRAIWMLAFNNVLVNLDSYTGPFKQNYYMIKDDNERFMSIIWDLNQSLGSFSMIESGGGPTDIDDLTDMDLFLRADETDFPLIYQLLSVPRYRKMYVAHVKTMVEENFADGSYYTRAEEMQDVISAEVAAEPNGFYTTTQFTSNLYETEGGGGGGPGGGVYGISEVMDPRVDYLEGLAEWSYVAPTIFSVETSPEIITAYESVIITANISDATYAYVAYRNDWQDAFEKIEMFDDGDHWDGDAGDGIYGVLMSVTSKDIQYYVYADNDDAGKFSPVRAEHEFYSIVIEADVVINEMMPQNNVSVTDPAGDFEDWIELYNNTGSSIDLSGYYLSDQPTADPTKYQIPDGTTIDANAYLIIWADEDTTEEGLHATFKLSSSGETIVLLDADGFEINKVKMPEMSSGTTYGRYPNGDGPFIRMFPTFAASNSYTALTIDENQVELEVMLYPNPANNSVTIFFESNELENIQVYDVRGQLIHQGAIYSNTEINVADWDAGLYLIVFPELGITRKLVKQ
ncbi:MAG: T9SS type A sorting domain-containing protein [Crocinitomix sp.]|nr:T9SS type A sorting domain-containing protein [Crocinitomix sp.]